MTAYGVTRGWHARALGWLDAAGARLRRRHRVPAEAPRRILVIRLRRFGDLILMLPALERLRELYPGARITWMVERAHAEFVASLGVVGEVWAVRGWWRGLLPRRRRFDLALDFHADLYRLLVGRIQARWLVGYGIRGGAFLPDVLVPYPQGVDASTRQVRLVEAAAPGSLAPPRLPRIVLDHPPQPGHFVLLHPGCGQPSKAWPLPRWQALARHCRARGYRLVLSGGPHDRALCAGIAQGFLSGELLDASGATDWQELARMVASAACVVAPDTGILHLAHALGTAAVGLYGPHDPAVWGYADHARHRSLAQRLPCSFCEWGRCPRVPAGVASLCLQALTVPEVAGALDEVMAALGRRSARARAVGAGPPGHGPRA